MSVINLEQITPREVSEADIAFTRKMLGPAAGCARIGVSHFAVPAGARQMPVHVHGDAEEIFFVLSGDGLSWEREGTLRLGEQEHPLGSGDIVARPPSTGVSHHITAGAAGLTYLVYGTRGPGDSVYYPDTGQVRLRGLGVTLDAAP